MPGSRTISGATLRYSLILIALLVVPLGVVWVGQAKLEWDRRIKAARLDYIPKQEQVSKAEVNRAVAMRAQMRRQMLTQMGTIAALAAIAAGTAILLSITFARRMDDELDILDDYFHNAAAHHKPIDVQTLGLLDLRALAESANSMVSDYEETRAASDSAVQALMRANTELERYAYVASHDLQEPLRDITSYAQLLQKRYAHELGDEADLYIHFIVAGTHRMSELIRDLLDYSRTASRPTLRTLTDCESILSDTLHDMQPELEACAAEVTHDTLPRLKADTVQIGRLLRHLIQNALTFRSETPPRVHISASHDSPEWHFAVRDNGIGIEPHFHDRVFIIYQRLHARDDYPGTGIGLAICKKIVTAHAGRIWVESKPGQGTTFHFTIPD